MGLIDRYKDSLKREGIHENLQVYKVRHNRKNVFLVLLVLVVGIPTYFLIFRSYGACTVNAKALSLVNTSSVLNNGFSVGCGVDAAMYAVIAALAIALLVFIVLKSMRYKRVA